MVVFVVLSLAARDIHSYIKSVFRIPSYVGAPKHFLQDQVFDSNVEPPVPPTANRRHHRGILQLISLFTNVLYY